MSPTGFIIHTVYQICSFADIWNFWYIPVLFKRYNHQSYVNNNRGKSKQNTRHYSS